MPATATDRIDGLTTSVAVKAPVQAYSTAPLTLAGEQTVNGVVCTEGDRVLVKFQADAIENGIYVVSTGNWTRARDFDGNRDVVQGTRVFVAESPLNFRVTTPDPIVIGTSALTFQLSNETTTAVTLGIVTPQDFGAVVDGVTDDSVAIQAALDYFAANDHRGIVRIPAGFYGVGAKLVANQYGVIRADPGSFFLAVDAGTQCLDMPMGDAYGNWDLPQIYSFSDYALKLPGTCICRVYIPYIYNCGDGILLETRHGTYQNMLDPRVDFDHINNCARGIVFDTDNNENLMQGIQIYGNFLDNNTISVDLHCSDVPGAPFWDGNSVIVQACNPVGNPGDVVIRSDSTALRFTFRVEGWVGLVSFDPTVKLIAGTFNECQFFFNVADQYPLSVGQIAMEGLSNEIKFQRQFDQVDGSIVASATANNLAGFNGGLPVWNNWNQFHFALPGELAPSDTVTCYVYHLFGDTGSNNITASAPTEGAMLGMVLDKVIMQHLTHPYEIALTFRNCSGITLDETFEFHFRLRVGLF